MTEASLGRIGKYDLRAEIGRGGFGIVYRAVDTSLGREVALKILHPQLTVDPEFIARFRQEAQTASQLDHPHIITIFEFGEADGRFFIAMRHIPGQSLKQLIAETGQLPLERVTNILGQVADALDYAHARGLIHRDVKSANILIGPNDHVTLTDFGLVRAAEASTYASSLSQGGGMVGTVEYLSPEQVEGQAATAKSDLYALGIVAYEMVTGRVPFKADTPLAVIRMQADKPAPDPRGPRPDLPEGVRQAILKALAKKPDERQPDATTFERELCAGWNADRLEHEVSRRQEAQRQAERELAETALWRAVSAEQPWAPGATRQHTTVPRVITPIVAPFWLVMGLISLLSVCLCLFGGLWFTNSFLRAPNATATALPTETAVPLVETAVPPVATSAPLAPTLSGLQLGSTQVSPADGMVLLYVPVGSFLMGSVDSDTQASSDEKPQHTVYLDAFWIDQTDVTNAMFAIFAKATGYQTDAERGGSGSVYSNGNWTDTKGANWQHPKGPGSNLDGRAEHPVVQVSWNDASSYCRWAGRRLPTEAEWEKAARGTDGRLYPWGNDALNDTLLNYNDKVGDTTAVDQYPEGASPYGTLDMAGNVWQWVADWYSDAYYSQSPSSNPTGPASGQFRVLRGGSWVDEAQGVRAAVHGGGDPGIRGFNLGFRCAR